MCKNHHLANSNSLTVYSLKQFIRPELFNVYLFRLLLLFLSRWLQMLPVFFVFSQNQNAHISKQSPKLSLHQGNQTFTMLENFTAPFTPRVGLIIKRKHHIPPLTAHF